jgi:hypothetical protein
MLRCIQFWKLIEIQLFLGCFAYWVLMLHSTHWFRNGFIFFAILIDPMHHYSSIRIVIQNVLASWGLILRDSGKIPAHLQKFHFPDHFFLNYTKLSSFCLLVFILSRLIIHWENSGFPWIYRLTDSSDTQKPIKQLCHFHRRWESETVINIYSY